jgi:hypothetical protein
MNDAKLIELAEDVAGLKVGMASIEGKLNALTHKLLGNGQPGFIADLQDGGQGTVRTDGQAGQSESMAGRRMGGGVERGGGGTVCLN